MRYLYHPGPFENWGHFDLSQAEFPRGWDGMKNCVEKIEKAGLFAGVHTLSNFITTNDPYVTPVPDTRLGTVGTTVISSDIDSRQNEIPIENPDYFNQYENNNLHTVMIGEELIRYEKVSETAPWKLMKCERGAWKTKSSDHKAGKKISMLTDHGYKVFLSNPELSKEIAKKLSEFYNYTGLRQISFDGLEGNRSTGMGNYGEILFTKTWWDNLSPEIKKHTVIDASRTTHYFWHIYSRMNWGEPWYAGFRESQTEYRLKNQEYFQRNLMPGMLGWFSLRPNTPVEDIEWMLARSAAFNAGYCLVTNERSLQTNGQTNEILKLVGEWEKARMANAFSNEQKEKMKDIANEFHLETKSENSWNLFQIQSFKFKHTEREHQPGEPTLSTFRFDNTDDSNKIHFIITAQDATIAKVKFELDNNNSFELPVPLHNGESVRYSGGDWIEIYSEQFNKVGAFKIDSEQFKVSKGAHSIVIDGVFADRLKEPALKIEIRIFGKPEPIQTKSE